jgi:hypothetical protein
VLSFEKTPLVCYPHDTHRANVRVAIWDGTGVEVDLDNDSEESEKIGLSDFERRVVISGFGEFCSRD